MGIEWAAPPSVEPPSPPSDRRWAGPNRNPPRGGSPCSLRRPRRGPRPASTTTPWRTSTWWPVVVHARPSSSPTHVAHPPVPALSGPTVAPQPRWSRSSTRSGGAEAVHAHTGGPLAAESVAAKLAWLARRPSRAVAGSPMGPHSPRLRGGQAVRRVLHRRHHGLSQRALRPRRSGHRRVGGSGRRRCCRRW